MATPRDDCPFPNYVVLPSLPCVSGDEEKECVKGLLLKMVAVID